MSEIDRAAREKNVGVIAAGNFAITAILLQRFACEAAKYLSHWEIVDYGWEGKPDAPSGTARELAYRLAEVRKPKIDYPVDDIMGEKEARGASLNGTQVHSVRLPGYSSSVDITFGAPGERLYLRHDGMGDAACLYRRHDARDQKGKRTRRARPGPRPNNGLIK